MNTLLLSISYLCITFMVVISTLTSFYNNNYTMVIKKTLIILLVAISIVATAQEKPFQFGVKAGPNLGWFNSSSDNYKNEGVDFGGSWGFVADFFIMENYSFTTGFDLLYLNGTMSYPHNYKHDTSSILVPGSLKRSYRTRYIKLPFIFTMKTNEINKVRYYGQIGFGLSILLSAKGNDEFTPDNGDEVITEEHNIYDDLLHTRESIIVGAGVEIPLHGSTYMRVGLVYDNAFVNILRGNNNVDTSVKNNGRNSFVGLDVCVLF